MQAEIPITEATVAYLGKRLEQAEADYVAAVAALRHAKLELAKTTLRRRDIRLGDVVLVDFKDGEEKCILEAVSVDRYDHAIDVRLRHFTKRGVPCKIPRTYGGGIIAAIKAKVKE